MLSNLKSHINKERERESLLIYICMMTYWA